ncbi:MAG TPA: DUF1579 family protein [Terriglobales bacterium]|nr:DUF1579 family protein [Terriglobales bacterium]
MNMIKPLSVGLAVVLVAAALCLAQQNTGQAPSTTPALSPELQKARQEREAASQPGPPHLSLMRLDGDYVTKEKYYPPGQTTPLESDGTATLRSEMGGRFIVERNGGGYLGEPYIGLRIYGFNNGTKKYEGVWTSSKSTSVISLLGESKDGGITIEYTGTYHEDTTGNLRTMQVTLHILDPDHFEVTVMRPMPDGSPGPKLVSLYTRKLLPIGS